MNEAEIRLIDRGMELADFKPGSKILEIGCGRGDRMDHLIKKHGMEVEGIDINLSKIADAKEKYPGINVKYGDGEFLDDYMSYTFDGILMRNSLNLINMPDEALHEAYCVMKKGGRLMLIDFYDPDPDEEQLRAISMEAKRQSRIPHKEGDCEEQVYKFVDFRYDGAFFKDPLIRQIEDTGFKVTAFEDVTEEVPNIVEEWRKTCDRIPGFTGKSSDAGRDIGYFITVAIKPL